LTFLAGNLFADLPTRLEREQLVELLSLPHLRVERIVSTGQATPPGVFYDQEWAEWIVLLQGSAKLFFEGEAEPRLLERGDFLHIPAHRRHRVEWTDPREPTLWLAIHHPG
jgi:cupin 2 domain-containing protein